MGRVWRQTSVQITDDFTKLTSLPCHPRSDVSPDPCGGVTKAPLAVVAAGVGGVAVGVLHVELGELGVHAVQLGHAVLLPVLVTMSQINYLALTTFLLRFVAFWLFMVIMNNASIRTFPPQ